MKYEIDIMKGTVPMENEADLREVIFGNPYDVIEYSEFSDLMDEAEAREEFEKLQATARRTEDGMIEFMIPELVCGEDLDEDIDEETGEKLFYLDSCETIDQRDFDDESKELFRELGLLS